jgi:hypothetical protein
MLSEAIVWLQSSEAAHVARRELERRRLPRSLADDVLQEARVRAWRLAEAHDTPADNPVGVARRAIQRAVADLHRRSGRRVWETDLEDASTVIDCVPGDVDVPGQLEDGCRRATHGRLAVRPWAGAAVLNELTFRLHPDVPLPAGAPGPAEGNDDHRVSWAALWLAGKIDCFPTRRTPDDAAMRQRRSRALAATANELRQVVEVALAGASR